MSQPLFHLAGLPVTAYALGMALSLILVSVLLLFALHKAGYSQRVGEDFLLTALPLGLVLSRASYVLIRLPFFQGYGEGLAFKPWLGGYALWGALLAFLLAGWFTSRRHHLRPAALLDQMVPAALVLLALGRAMEGLAGMGFGQEAPAFLHSFPVAVVNEWGEWRYAIFMLEAVYALVVMALVVRHRSKHPGDRLRLALVLFFVAQILFESLREDEVLSWGFVKAAQLLSAVGLFLTLYWGLFLGRVNTWKAPSHLALAAFFLLILGVTGLEFLIDKSNLNINLIYTLMALCCALLAVLVLRGASFLMKKRPQPLKEEDKHA